jgi:parallel beta-helix repeat protein
MTCYATGVDAENTTVIAYYQWLNNSVLIPSLSGSIVIPNGTLSLISTLGSGNTTQRNNWTCSVKMFDGQNNETDWNNDSMYIGIECGYTMTSGGSYVVTSDLSTSGTCWQLPWGQSNIQLDCQEHKITGGQYGYRTDLTSNNYAVRNCWFDNFTTAITTNRVEPVVIFENNKFTNTTSYGIDTRGDLEDYVKIINNTFINTSGIALWVDGYSNRFGWFQDSVIANNTFVNLTGIAFRMRSNNSNVYGNTFTGISGSGTYDSALFLTGVTITSTSGTNVITNNTFTDVSTRYGILSRYSGANIIRENNISNFNGISSAISLSVGNAKNIIDSNLINNSVTDTVIAVGSSTSSSNNVTNNLIINSSWRAMAINLRYNYIINNTILTSGSPNEAVAATGSNNTFINNFINDSAGPGFRMWSTDNHFISNQVNNSGTYGFYMGTVGNYRNNVTQSNKVDGKTTYYYWKANNMIIENLSEDQIKTVSTGVVTVVDARNVTIRNNNLSSNDTIRGISLFNVSYSEISGNRIYNASSGIWMDDILGVINHNNTIKNNRIEQGSGTGIFDDYSEDIHIFNNTIVNQGGQGVRLDNGRRYNISYNNISYNSNTQIYQYLNDNNTIFSNYLAGTRAIYFDETDNVNITNNTIFNTTSLCIYIYDRSDDNRIVNNSILDDRTSGNVCVLISQNSDRNTVEGNSIINSTSIGIAISSGCDYNNITNNSIYNSSRWGMSIDGTYNNIVNNTINKTVGDGIIVNSEYSTFDGNKISNAGSTTGEYGILVSSTNNSFSNNVITDSVDSGIYSTVANNSFWNNILGNNSDCGYEFSGADYNAVYNGIVDNNSVTGACIVNSDHNIFSGIFFSNNPIGIKLSSSALNNTLSNLTFSNNTVSIEIEDTFSTSIGDTDFPANSLFEDATDGVINFTENITFGNPVRLSDVINIANRYIRADSSTVPGLNRSALLTFTGLSISYDPRPTVDFEEDGTFIDCPASVCTEVSDTSSTFIYNVSHFTNYSLRDVPPGNVTGGSITIASLVPPNQTFEVTCSMQCTGELPCVGTTVTLDPLVPLTNLTQPTDYVQSVYADEDFIYAATDNKVGSGGQSLVHVWNKTDLSQITTLSTAGSGLKTVFADDMYIYAGGADPDIYVWNRTDLATPFANVFNISASPVGDVFAIVTDDRYIYAGGDSADLHVFNKTSPTFEGIINITSFGGSRVRALAVDSNFVYGINHRDCLVRVINTTDFSNPANLAMPGECDYFKDISVDNNSNIYAHGQFNSPYEAFTRIINKSDYSIVFDWNDTAQNYLGHAVHAGGPNYAYHGGFDTSYNNGWIGQINKTTWTIEDELNLTDFQVKDMYCDPEYLYLATQSSTTSDGRVLIFNNSCGTRGAAAPPGPIIVINVNSLATAPSEISLPSTVYCTANITFNGSALDKVVFNLTLPNGTSILLNSSNVTDIYNSTNFTVDSTSDYTCKVTANLTDGSSDSRSIIFSGGQKGTIPMYSGTPFYTINQNPRNGTNQSCLNSTQPGQICESTWTVNATGELGDRYLFFCTYESSQNSINTTKVEVEIGIPGVGVTRGPGGGSHSAARQTYTMPVVEIPPKEILPPTKISSRKKVPREDEAEISMEGIALDKDKVDADKLMARPVTETFQLGVAILSNLWIFLLVIIGIIITYGYMDKKDKRKIAKVYKKTKKGYKKTKRVYKKFVKWLKKK